MTKEMKKSTRKSLFLVLIILMFISILIQKTFVSAEENLGQIDVLALDADKNPVVGVEISIQNDQTTVLLTTNEMGVASTGKTLQFDTYSVKVVKVPEDYENANNDEVELVLPYFIENNSELQTTVLYQPKFRKIIEPTTEPTGDASSDIDKKTEPTGKDDKPVTDDLSKDPKIYLIAGSISVAVIIVLLLVTRQKQDNDKEISNKKKV